MKLMRHIIVTAIIVFMSNCIATCQVVKESQLTLKAVMKGRYSFSQSDDFTFFLIDIKLVNTSDSLYSFIVYSCETNLGLVVDSRQLIICNNECGSNFPRLINLRANQTFSIPIIIKVNKYSDIITRPVRVGLVLFNSKNLRDINDVLQNKENNTNIIWSNSMVLNSAGGQPYDIY